MIQPTQATLTPEIHEGQGASAIELLERGSISPAFAEWRSQAQRILAYPGDYGMTRREVSGLGRTLAQRS